MSASRHGRSFVVAGLLIALLPSCTSADTSAIDPTGAGIDGRSACGGAVSLGSVGLALGLGDDAKIVSETDDITDLDGGPTVPFRCRVGQGEDARIQFSFFSGSGDIAQDYLGNDIDENDRVETFAGTGIVVGGIDDDGNCLGSAINHPSLLLIVDYEAAQVPDGRDACQDAMALAVQTFNNLDLPQYDSAPIPNPRQFQWDGVIPPEAEDLIDGPFTIEPSTDG